MNIVFISQYFYPEQVSNNSMSSELVRRGHTVEAYTAVPNYPGGVFFDGYSNDRKRQEIWEGVHISRAWTIRRGMGKMRLALNYLVFPITASLKIVSDNPKSHVIFVSQLSPILMVIPGILQKWRSKSPLVYWVQDLWPESATLTLGIKNRLANFLLRVMCGWLYRQADMVLVQSEAFRAPMERLGVSPSRIHVLPNTAPAMYRPLLPSAAPDIAELVPQDGFRLMFAGNIGESQDFDTIIAAALLLRDRQDLHWIIVGSGRDQERVQQKVLELGLASNFYFLGRHPENTMPQFFAHADAMLVSLKSAPIFDLTVPYKVQCYMACGKPIVASLSGEGKRLILEAGAGTVADAGRPQSLANAIASMIDGGDADRAVYAANSLRYFERNYSAKKVYDQLENALTEAKSLSVRCA